MADVRDNDVLRFPSMHYISAILSTCARHRGAISYAAPGAAGYAGVPDHHFAAAMMYYAGAASYARHVRLPLMESAIKLRKRNRWPKNFATKPWVLPLVSMAIAEYLNPALPRRPGYWWSFDEYDRRAWHAEGGPGRGYCDGWWSPWIDCPAETWARTLSPRYESIIGILHAWRSSCTRRMGRQLIGDDLEAYSGHDQTYRVARGFHEEGRRSAGPVLAEEVGTEETRDEEDLRILNV